MKKLLSDYLNLFTPDNKIEVYFWWIIIPIILLLTLAIAYSIYFALKERNKGLSKKDLERKKLTSEIRSLKLFWLAPVSSLAIAVVAAVIGYWTGFFDTKLNLIEIRTIKLEIEEDSLKSRKLKLNKDLIKLSYKYDSIRGKLDSIARLNLSLNEKVAIALNTIEMKDSIIENKDTINARQARDYKKWTQSKQSPLDLKNEVLRFVQHLRYLLKVSSLFPDYELAGKLDSPDHTQFINPICYIYRYNYQEDAKLYRIKIDYVLGNPAPEDISNIRVYAIYRDDTPDIFYIKSVADDLEKMANKITN